MSTNGNHVAADAEAWLRLATTPRLSPAVQRRLLGVFGGPADVLAAGAQRLAQAAGEAVSAALASGPDREQLQRSIAWLQEPGHQLLTLADAEYPQALLQTPDPPLLLFVQGDAHLLSHASLAIVGSRNATPGGIRDAEAFAHALSDAGLTIVSGLALGIDGAAHRGGLRGASSSVAVVGTGLDRVYPSRHQDLAQRLIEQGVVVSEFPIGTPPLAANFPRRNRVLSGLARGCLVVEAAQRSGSLITARLALEQGRDVFAIPGSIHSPLSKGCHWLIQQGAKLVETAQDILDELGIDRTPTSRATPVRESLPPDDTALLHAMGFEPVDLDTICERARCSPETAAARMLSLELHGYVSRLPGGLYQRMR